LRAKLVEGLTSTDALGSFPLPPPAEQSQCTEPGRKQRKRAGKCLRPAT